MDPLLVAKLAKTIFLQFPTSVVYAAQVAKELALVIDAHGQEIEDARPKLHKWTQAPGKSETAVCTMCGEEIVFNVMLEYPEHAAQRLMVEICQGKKETE